MKTERTDNFSILEEIPSDNGFSEQTRGAKRTVIGTLTPKPRVQYHKRPTTGDGANAGSINLLAGQLRKAARATNEAVPKPQRQVKSQERELLTVKDLATLYGLSIGAVYAMIKAEPNFPYVNVGLKKKFMIEASHFETWLAERTEKQKHEHFRTSSALDLAKLFKNKTVGGRK